MRTRVQALRSDEAREVTTQPGMPLAQGAADQVPLMLLPDDEEEKEEEGQGGDLRSHAASGRDTSAFRSLATDSERLRAQPGGAFAHGAPPARPASPEQPSRRPSAIQPRHIPASLARAALERSQLRSGDRAHADGGPRRAQARQGLWDGGRANRHREQGGWGRWGGVGEQGGEGEEPPEDPEELRARYTALRREYLSLKGKVAKGWGQQRRGWNWPQGENYGPNRRSGGLGGPEPGARAADVGRLAKEGEGARGAVGPGSRQQPDQRQQGQWAAPAPQPPSEGARILQRLAVSRPPEERARSDKAFVQELEEVSAWAWMGGTSVCVCVCVCLRAHACAALLWMTVPFCRRR